MDVLNRTRAAIITSRVAITSTAPAGLDRLTKWQAATRVENHARAATLPRLEALTARDGLPLPTPTVQLARRAACPDLADITDLDTLKAGPRRLLASLHSLGVHVVAARGYACAPNQVTYHLSQELLALSLSVTTKSVQSWTRELEALGLLDTRAHYGGNRSAARIDGLVLAVSMKPGHTARLHHDDLAHQWRDLEADRKAGRTAWAARQHLMSESVKDPETVTNQVLRQWAVAPGFFTSLPLNTDSDIAPRTVQDVVYTLPLLGDIPPRERPALVGKLAHALAHGLNDHHSRAWYASLIWQALEAEQNGIPALQPLAALLARLWADCGEWQALRRPGALLAARLRPSSSLLLTCSPAT